MEPSIYRRSCPMLPLTIPSRGLLPSSVPEQVGVVHEWSDVGSCPLFRVVVRIVPFRNEHRKGCVISLVSFWTTTRGYPTEMHSALGCFSHPLRSRNIP